MTHLYFFLLPRRDGFIEMGKWGERRCLRASGKNDGFDLEGEGNAMFVSNDLVRCSLV